MLSVNIHPGFLGAAAVVLTLATTAGAADKKVCDDAFEQAQVFRKAHQLLSARDQLRTCVRPGCRWAPDCTKWLGEVEAIIPSLVFEAKDAAGNDVSSVRVTMDGQPFVDKLDGTALQVGLR